jgi:hypothetical protein
MSQQVENSTRAQILITYKVDASRAPGVIPISHDPQHQSCCSLTLKALDSLPTRVLAKVKQIIF